MDLKYINPFVSSAITVIREMVGIESTKNHIYIAKGKDSLGGVSIFLNIQGDVEGQIIFDLPYAMANEMAKQLLGLNIPNFKADTQERADLFKSALKELGNMISGNAIMRLEEYQYNCTIDTPKFYMGPKTKITSPFLNTIVIEMKTSLGNFLINLVNKKENYLRNVHFLLVRVDDQLIDGIVLNILSKGFYIYKTNDLRLEGKKYLEEKNIDFVLMDVDGYIDDLELSIDSIRKHSKNDNIRIILHSYNQNAHFLKRMQNLGVSGYILKSFNDYQKVEKLKMILSRLGVKLGSQRKGLSLSFNNKSYKINLTLEKNKNGQKIRGRVVELSLIGLVFVMEEGGDQSFLKDGLYIKDIQLDLRGKFILCDGLVEGIQGERIKLKYVNLQERFANTLSRVLFERLQVDEGEKDFKNV